MSEEQKPEVTEDLLLSLGLGIVPSDHEPITPPLNEPIQMIDGSLMNYVHDHIPHWLGNVVYNKIINLPQVDKARYFQMITDYGDIFEQVLNDDNNVIYEYVKGNPNPWAKIEAHAAKSGMVVDYERPAQLIKEYQEWRSRKGL